MDPGPDNDVLLRQFTRKVFEMNLKHFAWEGESILGASVQISQMDIDILIDELAEYLFQTRKQEHIYDRAAADN